MGGTLLGAYTRQSLIPWDEDIDISIFEEDYEKAKEVLIKELPSWCMLQCEETEPKYYHEWIKVVDKNSSVYPANTPYKENGCWVDIYKLRKMHKCDVDYNIALDHLTYLKRRLKVNDITKKEYNQRVKKK